MSQRKLCPPRGFKSAGVLEWARFSPNPPPFVRPQRHTGRRAAGIRYEKKAQAYFLEIYGEEYLPSPWFYFKEAGVDRPRWCQPDGLLFDFKRGQITLIEFKLQHTADAWWQLKWLYSPVVSTIFPPSVWKYGLCEVTRWYDPATVFPEKVHLREHVEDTQVGNFSVHIWKP